ncbi:unnamed protein product [Medioppia subpectinata]|uniref:C2H2-type domain-containing protein n=1 Tax=Medioppia subpectinata TaxID=1979941 RepID=A0A7R9KIG3_9ACAR|nr:unnamed protein product [Medioppia subpectinata]CAG2104103.1 unnamed protein product [Medioppia subpectinata]
MYYDKMSADIQEINSDNQLLIDSLEDYKTIITDGWAQHSTQTTTTHNWPLDTQTTPVGHRSETITAEDLSLTAEDVESDGPIETDTGSDGCVDTTNDETIEAKKECSSKAMEAFKCDFIGCHFETTLTSTLTRHRNRHHFKAKHLVCPKTDCTERFVTKTELRRHLSAHTGLKAYRCQWPGCGAAYTGVYALTDHQRKHTGDLQYACNECPKRFPSRGQLTHHRNGQHILRDQRFRTEARLVSHMDDHNEVKPYKCWFDGCEKCFADKQYLNRHHREE